MKNQTSEGYILGIDPGTSCGWAVLDKQGNRIDSGAWDLSSSRHEGGGMRYLRFRRYLIGIIDSMPIEAVSYEEVRRHRGTSAAHVYGGLIAELTEICEDRKVPYMGIPVGTIKKLATGKGNSGKTKVASAANKKWSLNLDTKNKPNNSDLDQSDALWIAECLRKDLYEDN